MNEVAEVCRELRQLADRMPAGPERERTQADLSRLHARLSALPAPMLPLHVSYEVGRRAAASGELRATKIGGDWFVTKADVADWLATSGKWFASESAVQTWHAGIAQLARWWIP